MKNFTKIFLAVVAGMFAFSCVTDTTEDAKVLVGSGVTEFTLSLEESKTQLGEKDTDGKYPLYWSQGDQISINGVPSIALSENYDGAVAATFSFETASLNAPYCVVYPASEGVGEGATYPVTFAAEQPYTVGTFATGTAPMYGYAAEATSTIEMHHLTGVLRLAVKGSGEAITKVVATSESGKIAGEFTVNCTNGTLVAGENASDKITVTFAEPLVLGEVATPIYVAVPAGSYGKFAITLCTATDKMQVKFDSESKPITAGIVREFNEFTYIPNIVETSDAFEIDGKDALIEFASIAASFAPYTQAKVTAEIDMTGYNWTPIEEFGDFLFDGGNFAIKGLNAPLFGTTNADIKNVKLTDIAMTTNGLLRFGAIVCHPFNSTIENCEVSGTITVSNPDFVPAESYDVTNTVIVVGGISGYSQGTNFIGCNNRANITISQIAQSAGPVIIPCFAGVTGFETTYTSDSGDVIKGTITNCSNYGAISYEDNSTERWLRPCIAGVVGYSPTANELVISGCNNHGAISMKNCVTNGAAGHGSCEYVGGVVGKVFKATITSCTNHATGTITVDGDLTYPCVGGVLAYSNYGNMSELHNLGAIEIKSTATIIGTMTGGVVGCAYATDNGPNYLFTQSTNDAPVKVLASTRNIAAADLPNKGAYYYRVGGVVGFARQTTNHCENKANGDVTTAGSIKIMTTNTETTSFTVSGCVPYSTTATPSNLVNRGDITVNNTVVLDSLCTASNQPYLVSGCVGTASYNPHTLTNHGKISVGGKLIGYNAFIGGVVADGMTYNIFPHTSTNYGTVEVTKEAELNIEKTSYVAGIIGITERANADVKDATNNGAILFDGTISKGGLRMGGITGYTKSYMSNLTNNAPLTIGENATAGYTQIGGVIGYYAVGTVGTSEKWTNTANGDITVKGTLTGQLRVGGCIGDKCNDTSIFNTFTNAGDITVLSDVPSTLCVGGNVGIVSSNTNKGKDEYTDFTNTGAISLNGTFGQYVWIAGCIGHASVSDKLALKNMTNNAPITVVGTTTTTSDSCYIGGVIAHKNGAGDNGLYNNENGDITVNLTSSGVVRIAGVAVKLQDGSSNMTNKGDITVAGSYNSTVSIGGMTALTHGYNRSNLLNEGTITFKGNAATLVMGGLYTYGAWDYGVTNGVNKGNLIVTREAVISGSAYMGGIIGYRINPASSSGGQPLSLKSGCNNSGNIEFHGTCATVDVTDTSAYNPVHGLYIGGMVGQSRWASDTTDGYSIRADGFTNSGNIVFDGEVKLGGIYIGGIAGDMDQTMTTKYFTGTLTNLGNITCTGKTKTGGYVGGIIGEAKNAFQNCQSYCTIKAAGYTGAGMILGNHYSSALVSNAKLGGVINRDLIEETDASGDTIMVPGPDVTLNASNYFKYIYGNATDETVASAGSCVLLEAAPAL